MIPYQNDREKALLALKKWFEENPFYGYDPYDIKGKAFISKCQKWGPARKTLNVLLELFPKISRQMMNVKKQINPKGIGLLALANIVRYASSQDEYYRQKAELYLEWLKVNAVTQFDGVGWGYPFDWQSRIFIPAGTPSSVVSVICGNAFLEYRKITGKTDFDDLIFQIAVFISKGLNRHVSESGICFSYTPLDTFTVHNANLFSAWFLSEAGTLFKNETWIDLGLNATKYTLADQNFDGSFTYWGPPMKTPVIDSFHTGYVLRMLYRLSLLFPEDPGIKTAINKGMDYYISHMLMPDGFPKDNNSRKWPINIHTLNEWVMVFTEIPTYRDLMANKIIEVLEFLLFSMQYRPGLFAYKKYPFFTVKIPYFRWNQAWTYLALSSLEHIEMGTPQNVK
ncbi:TPA: hypothetical protein DCG86_01060 [Candidatus Marinimicrobia bacterium]|nr:MAG: hypothetical protein XD77_0428 [Marinimicrobia bacterium 46_47]HAE86592.1 hypothetical protein [Candidatus Neomarinimicrobiota bacterium]HBY19170.1 hypothetical protein [Candidatus Neomarinimicrobiota bacterium]